MIVSVRGIQSSGKSHLVRSIMTMFPKREEARLTGRRKPVGYRLHGLESPLYVPGLYEGETGGGVGSLNGVDEVYGLIWQAHDAGYDVLYESTDDVSRLTALFGVDQAKIVFIDRLISQCVLDIRDRGGKIRVEVVQRLDRKLRADETKLRDAGYEVSRLDRALAAARVKEILGLQLP